MLDLGNSSSNLTLLFLAIYSAVVILAAWFARTKDNDTGFAIGARKVGVIPTVGSLISGMRDGGGVALWLFVGAATAYHFYWLVVGIVLAFIIFAILSPKIRAEAHEKKYITQIDFLEDGIGPHTAKVQLVITLIFALLAASGQLFVAGQVLSSATGFSKLFGIGLSAAIVGFYLCLGGYKTLIFTDVVQWIIMSAILIVPFFFVDLPPFDPVFDSFLNLPASDALSMVLLVIFLFLAQPDIWQRMFSLKSPRTGPTAFLLTIPFFLIVTPGLSIFGFYLGGEIDGITSANVLDKVFSSNILSPLTISLAAVAVTAIAMSTLDTVAYVFTSTIAKNAAKINPAEQHEKYVRYIRHAILALMIPLVLVAYFVEDIVAYIINSYSLIGVLTPALLYNLFKKGKAHPAFDRNVALVTALAAIVYMIMFFTNGFINFWYNMIPFAIPAVMIPLLDIKHKRA